MSPKDGELLEGELCRTTGCRREPVMGALYCTPCYDQIEEENGLLEACRLAKKWENGEPCGECSSEDVVRVLCAAIAKAEGKS